MASEIFFDLVVSRHGLANFCFGILIPIVPSAMSDENCALLFNSLNQLASFHASSSSEC
jgi:exoribonuclease II